MEWSSEQKDHARLWSKQLKLNAMEFRRGAKWARLWFNVWGGLGIVLGLGVMLESIVGVISDPDRALLIAGAVMAGLAEGCSVIITFYDFAKRNEEHRRASRKSDKVARSIDIELTKEAPEDWDTFAGRINKRFAYIMERAPSAPTSTYDELQLTPLPDIDARLDGAMVKTNVPAWVQHQFKRLDSSV